MATNINTYMLSVERTQTNPERRVLTLPNIPPVVRSQIEAWVAANDESGWGSSTTWSLRPFGHLLPRGARPVAVFDQHGNALVTSEHDMPEAGVLAEMLDALTSDGSVTRVVTTEGVPLELHYPREAVRYVDGWTQLMGTLAVGGLAQRVTAEGPDGRTVVMKDRNAPHTQGTRI